MTNLFNASKDETHSTAVGNPDELRRELARFASAALDDLLPILSHDEPAWQTRIVAWLGKCWMKDAEAISRQALRTAIADLVTWRNAVCAYRLDPTSEQDKPRVMVVEDLGGAVVLGHLLTELCERVRPIDPNLTWDLAKLALDLRRDQLDAIAKLIDAR